MKNKIFISYARKDFEIARKLYNDLKKAGYAPWLDKESLLPGENWKITIRKAIKESAYFLALISSESVSKRGFVQKELNYAIDILDEFPENDIFLIPARIEECNPSHSRIEEINWVDLFPSYEEGLKKIIATINLKKEKQNSLVNNQDIIKEEQRQFYIKYISLAFEIHNLCRKKFLLLEKKRFTIRNIDRHPISLEIKHKRDNIQKIFNEMTIMSPSDICRSAQDIIINLIMFDAACLAINKNSFEEYYKKLIDNRDAYIKAVRKEFGLDEYKFKRD